MSVGGQCVGQRGRLATVSVGGEFDTGNDTANDALMIQRPGLAVRPRQPSSGSAVAYSGRANAKSANPEAMATRSAEPQSPPAPWVNTSPPSALPGGWCRKPRTGGSPGRSKRVILISANRACHSLKKTTSSLVQKALFGNSVN